jgi:1-acyl-sn-glycerol-3-phosphate acyltransferase
VVVANHTSWLDSFILASWLPAGFIFVAGGVLGRQHMIGFVLRRVGTEFVERHEPSQGVADTARLARLARKRSLVFFPEGGVARAAGLRPFHMGAFVAAAQAGRPVVPVVIRGSRAMLRAGQRRVHPGAVALLVGEAIRPADDDWRAALELQRQARAFIVQYCGEPELS